jgi:hypothetical protein
LADSFELPDACAGAWLLELANEPNNTDINTLQRNKHIKIHISHHAVMRVMRVYELYVVKIETHWLMAALNIYLFIIYLYSHHSFTYFWGYTLSNPLHLGEGRGRYIQGDTTLSGLPITIFKPIQWIVGKQKLEYILNE